MHSLVILLMHFKGCISERAIKGEPCWRENAVFLQAQLKFGREGNLGACG